MNIKSLLNETINEAIINEDGRDEIKRILKDNNIDDSSPEYRKFMQLFGSFDDTRNLPTFLAKLYFGFKQDDKLIRTVGTMIGGAAKDRDITNFEVGENKITINNSSYSDFENFFSDLKSYAIKHRSNISTEKDRDGSTNISIQIRNLLKDDPSVIDEPGVQKHLDSLSSEDVADILGSSPELYEKLNTDLSIIEIAYILTRKEGSKLVDKFGDKMGELKDQGPYIGRMILQTPNLIKYFKDNLDKVDPSEAARIVIKYPNTEPYFDEHLKRLNPDSQRDLMIKDNKFIDIFKNNFNGYNSDNIAELLIKLPETIKYFESSLTKIHRDWLNLILLKQPKLVNYFKDRLGEISDMDRNDLIKRHPELEEFFR